MILAAAAAPAMAASTGGAAAGATSTAPAAAPAPAPVSPAIHLSPITAKSTRLSYKGPVYQKTATGEVVPYQASTPAPASTGPVSTATGGAPVGSAATSSSAGDVAATELAAEAKPQLLVPGSLARYVNGLAAAPMSAPASVQQVIWAANQIIGLPYIFGGGHASFVSPGYDCSGTVSFALHGASLISTPMDSSEFEGWGGHGIGRWVTIFTNPEHAYMTIAGLRLDTSSADDPTNEQGPRWRPLRPANAGFMMRHPAGL
jgi:cell wall-associated NlpC family hydrolase